MTPTNATLRLVRLDDGAKPSTAFGDTTAVPGGLARISGRRRPEHPFWQPWSLRSRIRPSPWF
ncbi:MULTISPECIES: hypothetical protein [unclassified Cryobacterium]|uniref:hypothetical protein n=1 Tax=unclassified Cryobacterium TaxID=2649013 RepID=UPI00141BA7AC|nr:MULTISPECIES: hypothetical protein [unclassified Cryobacterium]